MRYRYLGLAFAALFASVANAQKAPNVRIPFVEETLPNGLHVIYSVDRTTPVVATEVMYNVGSKNEEKGRTGFAHLFEHVMFKGSKNVADGAHFGLLEKAGARAGSDINGTTAWDRTNYFEQVPSNYHELALWLESDRMGTLTETLTKAKLDNQREVVKNERRQSVDNQPYGTWLEKTGEYIFPEGHPYHHSIIGSMDDLSAASVDDVKKFFKTYYAPNNAVLVIAGDFDVTQAKALVRKHFGWIPRGLPKPALANTTIPKLVGAEKREVIQDPNAPAPQVYVSYRMPSARTSQSAAVQLLSSVLAGGRSSPFYNSLVRTKQIAVGVQAFNLDLLDGGDAITFIATGKASTNPDSLEKALITELDNALSKIDQATLNRQRQLARFNYVNGLQTTGGFGGRADALAEAYTFFKNPNRVNQVLAEYDAVTVPQLRALVKERLVPSNRVTLVYVPARKPAAGTN
jgi:predicted Zn-dependent peptidase